MACVARVNLAHRVAVGHRLDLFQDPRDEAVQHVLGNVDAYGDLLWAQSTGDVAQDRPIALVQLCQRRSRGGKARISNIAPRLVATRLDMALFVLSNTISVLGLERLMSTREDVCPQRERECPLALGPAAYRRRPGTLRGPAGRDVLSEPRNPSS
jgi:hypothetical protein